MMGTYDDEPAVVGHPDDGRPVGGLAGPLDDLRSRLDQARADRVRGVDPEAHDLLSDLEAAYAALVAADGELRLRHDLIDELRRGRTLARAQHDRMLAAVPVPALVTDAHGVIRAANPAAAGLVELRVGLLLGTPVMSLFPIEDRAELRRLLAEQAADGDPFRRRTAVVLADGSRVGVEITAALMSDVAADVTWVFAETEPGRDGTPQRLPAVLARLSALTSPDALHQLLDQVVRLCEEALGPGVELTITVGAPHQPTALASTGERAQHLDRAQLGCGEGPVFVAHQTARVVRSHELRDDLRWPRLAAQVPDGIGAVLAVPIIDDGRVVGAVVVYGAQAAPLDGLVTAAELVGATLAAVLRELDVKAELRDLAFGLERALASRAVIDQAKGIVMADLGLTADQAFDHLVQLSTARQVELRDVARDLVARRSGA